MNRRELQILSRMRLLEARLLLRSGAFHGAYYIAGYAIECALKACIAKQVKRFQFPDKKFVTDSHTHDLDKLLDLAGLRATLQQDSRLRPALLANWNVVKDWKETARYDLAISPQEARDIYSACTGRRHGVLPWLRGRW